MESNTRRLRIDIRVSADPKLGAEVIFHSKSGDKRFQPATTQQGKADPWIEMVKPCLVGKNWVTCRMIATDCLKLDPSQDCKSHQMRIARILRSLGWTRKQLWRNGKNTPAWVPLEFLDDYGQSTALLT